MNTLRKRVLSSILAISAAASMAVPAFAADAAPKNTTVVTGKYAETDIAVTVPGATNAVINPYGLGVELKDSNERIYNVAGKIMTPDMAVKNQSGMNLQVGAKVMTKVTAKMTDENGSSLTSGYFKLVNSSIASDTTTKQALVQLQMVTATGIAGEEDAVGDKIIAAYANEATWADADKVATVILNPPTSSKSEVETILPDDESKKVTLAAAKVSDGAFASYNDGSIALVRLTGDCVANPKIAWAAEDGFVATIVFTFSPATAAEETPAG